MSDEPFVDPSKYEALIYCRNLPRRFRVPLSCGESGATLEIGVLLGMLTTGAEAVELLRDDRLLRRFDIPPKDVEP